MNTCDYGRSITFHLSLDATHFAVWCVCVFVGGGGGGGFPPRSFNPSTSTRRARRSAATSSDKD